MDYTVERIPGHLVVDPHGGDHGQGHRRKQHKGYGKETAWQGERGGDSVEISAEARRRAEEEAAAERAADEEAAGGAQASAGRGEDASAG